VDLNVSITPSSRAKGKLAVLNDLKIYILTNAMLEDYLADEARVKVLLKRLKI